jgi:hypothetical protein
MTTTQYVQPYFIDHKQRLHQLLFLSLPHDEDKGWKFDKKSLLSLGFQEVPMSVAVDELNTRTELIIQYASLTPKQIKNYREFTMQQYETARGKYVYAYNGMYLFVV